MVKVRRRHQAEAWRAAAESNLVITTPTASGKSLAFNLPVFDGIARKKRSSALYLYPTKALAQDQARAIAELNPPGLKYAIYDGDTPKERRAAIRRESNLVMTNPDMVHVGVLPNHEAWGDFLTRLDWVVIDEAHTYRGVFGSNVANVIRRLRRLCAATYSELRGGPICSFNTYCTIDKYSKERCVIGQNTEITFDCSGRNKRCFARPDAL